MGIEFEGVANLMYLEEQIQQTKSVVGTGCPEGVGGNLVAAGLRGLAARGPQGAAISLNG